MPRRLPDAEAKLDEAVFAAYAGSVPGAYAGSVPGAYAGSVSGAYVWDPTMTDERMLAALLGLNLERNTT